MKNLNQLTRGASNIFFLIPVCVIFSASLVINIPFWIMIFNCNIYDLIASIATGGKADPLIWFWRDNAQLHITNLQIAGWLCLSAIALISFIYFNVLFKTTNWVLAKARGFESTRWTLFNSACIYLFAMAIFFCLEFGMGNRGIYDQFGTKMTQGAFYGLRNGMLASYFGFTISLLLGLFRKN